MKYTKKSKIVTVLVVLILAIIALLYMSRHGVPNIEDTVIVVPGYEISKEIANLIVETNGDGTIKVIDSESRNEMLTIVEMVQTYKNLNDYESERINSGKILLDCEAARPGSIQHCNSVKSVVPLRNDTFFAAKYSLQGKNLSGVGESILTYDIIDILLPDGILLSGTVGSNINDEKLRLIANSFRKQIN